MKWVAIILSCLMLVGCSQEPIRIAAVGDYDGNGQGFAKSGVAGMELAISELGGQDRFELFAIDVDQMKDPKFVSGELARINPDFFVGPYLSSELEVIYPIFVENEIFAFIPSATLNVLEGNDDFVYRFINTTDDQVKQFAELLSKKGFSNTLLLYDVNNQGYSKALAQGIYDTGKIANPTVSVVEDNFFDQVSDWSLITCDSVVIVTSGKKSGEIVQVLRNEGLEVPIYLSAWSHNPDTIKYVGDFTENLFVFTNGFAEKSDNYKKFTIDLYEKYSLSTSTASQYAYESIYFIDYLNSKFNPENKQKMQSYLTDNPNFDGPFFMHHLDSYGQGTHEMQLLSIEDGEFVNEEQ